MASVAIPAGCYVFYSLYRFLPMDTGPINLKNFRVAILALDRFERLRMRNFADIGVAITTTQFSMYCSF
jgi:hypothetical protein